MKYIITIFGSARAVESSDDYRIAYEIGKQLALAGFTICNGGYGGIMEASARGAKEAAGKTIGVTFSSKYERIVNKWIDEEILCPTLIERLMKLIELGDAYVVLKGGTGTLLEFAAVWEFINKNLLKEKPIIIIGDFWERITEPIREQLIFEGYGDCTKFIYRVSSPEECVSLLHSKLR